MSRTLIAFCIILLFIFGWLYVEQSTEKVRLAGGPHGGTFIVFTEGLADLLQQKLPGAEVNVKSSGGSVANLQSIEQGKVDIALAYAGDAYLGQQGLLKKQLPAFKQVRALGRIYGSTAQLVTLKKSPIETPEDLVGRRVAIGNPGSGAAHSAERYFRTLGIWDEITPLYMGYNLGMTELTSGRAQAAWQLVGAPSISITRTNRKQPLRLIDLSELAQQSDFLLEYPIYTRTYIPAATYFGQTDQVESFQDNALIVVNQKADPQLVRTLLEILFSSEGKQQMLKVHPVAKELTQSTGLQGVKIPLHPAAERFWREHGVMK